MLCRRKPSNLTPPLSSDGGSSTSGQSPTSTHNGSPPPAVKRPPLNSDKYQISSSSDGPTSKKQRISHYRKDIVNQDTNTNARSKYNSNGYPICSDDNLDMLNYRRDLVTKESAIMNSRSRDITNISMDESSMRSSSYYG